MRCSFQKSVPSFLLLTALLLGGCSRQAAEVPTQVAAPTAAPTQTPRPTAVPTPAPTPTPSERSTAIDTMAYTQTADGAKGLLSLVTISVEPGEGRVAFSEEGPQAIGNQWQAAGWTAVLLGALLNGVDSSRYDFSFSASGRIDGPSAGGLMTVGVLSALRGVQVAEDATMTGTINPDGTIGPVGGIPHKIAGAAEAGKKLVLVPIGQRYDYDENRQELVDVVEAGKELGVEVREVGTVFDAYEQLTGDSLPRPKPASGAVNLPSDAVDRMRASTQNQIGIYQKERAQAMALPEDVLESVADSVNYADEQAQKADEAVSQGLFAVGYEHAYSAASAARQASLLGEMIERYSSGGLEGVISQLESVSSVRTQMEAQVKLLQAKKVTTVSDVMTIFDAYSEIAIGEGRILVADGIVQDLASNGESYTEEDALAQVFQAAQLYTQAADAIQLAQDMVDIGLGFGSEPAPDQEQIERIARSMQKAADTNMAAFESVVMEPAATDYDMSLSAFKDQMFGVEALYQLAEASRYGIEVLKETAGGEDKAGALVFGHSQTTYTLGAMLLAKYYSLDAQTDETLRVTSFGRTKALGQMLDFADKRAHELISAAGDETPIRAIYYYENAQTLRQSGDAEDQLSALSYYWQASLLCQFTEYMAGGTE